MFAGACNFSLFPKCSIFCLDSISCVSPASAATFGTQSQSNWTALILAVWCGRAELARLLLDAGADTEAKDEVRSSRAAANPAGVARNAFESIRIVFVFGG